MTDDPIRRILLATDLTAGADRAGERAIQLALEHGAELAALYSLGEFRVAGLRPSSHEGLSPSEIEAEILRHLAVLPGGDGIVPTVVTSDKPIDEAMAEFAAYWRPDIMVAGAHRSDTLLDLFSLSTVERISVADPSPLLVVRGKTFGAYASALLPTDFSGLGRPALDQALRLIGKGRVQILHVFDVPLASAALEHAELDRSGSFAEDFAALLRGVEAGERVVDTRVMRGPTAKCILDMVRDDRPDLVVMGTAGRSGVGRAIFGSTAHELLEYLPTDVLLVRG
jgi:nucleotide-binding universal stress UspA family protein